MGPLPAQHMGPQNPGQPPVGFLAPSFDGVVPFHCPSTLFLALGPQLIPQPHPSHILKLRGCRLLAASLTRCEPALGSAGRYFIAFPVARALDTRLWNLANHR